MPDDESAKRDEVLKRLLKTPPAPKAEKKGMPQSVGRPSAFAVGNYRVEYIKLPTDSAVNPIMSWVFWSNEPSVEYFLSLARTALTAFWRQGNAGLEPVSYQGPIPEAVRIVTMDGDEVCRWTLVDVIKDKASEGDDL